MITAVAVVSYCIERIGTCKLCNQQKLIVDLGSSSSAYHLENL